ELINKENRTFKNKKELITIFKKKEILIDKEMAFTCGSGITACILGLANSIISGNDVKLLKNFNKDQISKYIKKYHHLMFQKFIPQISKGDKRVFIIDGKVKGAISRLPIKGSILSNMSKGASAKKIKITYRELKISIIVAKELKRKKIYFAGIDFINGKLIGDINVTSPTGLKTYYDLTGINLAEYFFDNI
ncbi:hypothetical protein OAL84_01645, partial [Pelagibacteraceae bacterium]|nr:hypothetical protein [Pelagibacteraceae bacterium]